MLPAISASKIPGTGTGLGVTPADGTGRARGVEAGGIPAEGGLAPTVRPGIGGKGGRVDPATGPSPAGGLAPTINPAIGGSDVVGIEDPAGGFAPIIRPGTDGKAEETPGEAGFIPKVASRSSPGEAGLLVTETEEAGITVGIGFFTLGSTTDAKVPAGFAFVAKVKISFVPGSAFSAIAVPP
jgi:hypothetical protein